VVGGLCRTSMFTAKALLLPRPMSAAATNCEAFLFVCPTLSIAENRGQVNGFQALALVISGRCANLLQMLDPLADLCQSLRRILPNVKLPRLLQVGRSFRQWSRVHRGRVVRRSVDACAGAQIGVESSSQQAVNTSGACRLRKPPFVL
jgi:hypothetical protein